MSETISKYGFSVGQIVQNKIPLTDENGGTVPKNTKLKIVAIAPKVRKTNPFFISREPEKYDSKEYFVNLVRADQEKEWGNRFRENFVTIGKIKA